MGDTVARGERVGLIKFGSRVDVLFDSDAAVQVKPGDRVKGGATVLALFPVPAARRDPAAKPSAMNNEREVSTWKS